MNYPIKAETKTIAQHMVQLRAMNREMFHDYLFKMLKEKRIRLVSTQVGKLNRDNLPYLMILFDDRSVLAQDETTWTGYRAS